MLIVAVVAIVLGSLAIAIGRQREAGERARRSQAVIAAANLTQQRLLAVQTNIRGYPDQRQPRPDQGLPLGPRAGFPPPHSSSQLLVERYPAQRRLAELIRAEALGYVNSYADPVIVRTREQASAPGGRSRAPPRAQLRAEDLFALIDRLATAERALSKPARRATPTPRPSARC